MTNDPLDKIEHAAVSLGQRAQWETANRVGLLRIHAIVGILGGAQILAYGGPSNIEESVGVWTRLALGLTALVGGLVLWFGIQSKPRHIRLEAFGLALVGAWDLAMTLGLGYARISQGSFVPIPIFEALAPTYVRPYPVTVYAGLFGLICVHLWTLRKMNRGHR